MARILIKSFPATGFDGVFRGGRKWPASGTLVETIPGKEDVESVDDQPLKIGTVTLAALKGDGRISFVPPENIEDIDALKAENETLKARVAELEAAAANKGGKK